MEEIIRTIQNTDSETKFTIQNEAVLLLGETGSGKSTSAQFLAGDITSLIATGAGNYLIVDKNNRISREDSTILSQTIYPELLVNADRNVSFYDCPGFRDTRSTLADLTAAYVTRKLVKSCERIKLVFVINHNAVQEGMDRNSFMDLVKYASAFIKNFPKYKDSIALIVTKIHNPTFRRKDGHFECLGDEAIIEQIVKFLLNVKTEIRTVKKPGEKQHLYNDTVKFIDILLVRDGHDGRYTRIGLFRSPDQIGPLSKIKLLMDGKKSLEAIIHDNLKFTSRNDQDFGYSISDESKNFINKSIEAFVDKTMSDLRTIVDSIDVHFNNLEKYRSASELDAVFKEQSDFWKKIWIRYQRLSETSTALNFLINTFASLSISISQGCLSSLKIEQNFLLFLEDVCNNKFKIATPQWKHLLGGINDKVQDASTWYNMLLRLHLHLSQYSEQNRDRDEFKDLKNRIQGWLKHRNSVRGKQLKPILDKIYPQNNIKDLSEVSVIQLKHLRDVLELNISGMDMKLNGNCISFRRNIIKLSELPIPHNIKCLEIFASVKVFIDCDLKRAGTNLTIVAPTWEIIGEGHVIVLDGADGAEYEQSAKNGESTGRKGHDGEPGRLGGSAGSFFGIGSNFINGRNLKITANGGRGGRGQNGGNGQPGKNGENAHFDEWRTNLSFTNKKWQITSSAIKHKFLTESEYTWVFPNWWIHHQDKQLFEFFGCDGTAGGAGGDGGMSGIGGNRGVILIKELSNKSEIITESNDGPNGDGSQGGTGGVGGANGNNLRGYCVAKRLLFTALFRDYEINFFELGNISRGHGTNGISGISKGICTIAGPHTQSHPGNHSLPEIVNKYKKFATNLNLMDTNTFLTELNKI